MKATWQLQTAKAKFSEVLDTCTLDGPQAISRHGHVVAYIVGADDFEAMRKAEGHRVNLAAKRRRLARIFGRRKLRGNVILENRR